MGSTRGFGDEYMLGMHYDTGIHAPFIDQEESLHASTGLNFIPLLNGQTARVREATRKVLVRSRPTNFTCHLSKGPRRGLDEILRGAVLLHLDVVKEISFSILQGFGMFLRNYDLKKISKAGLEEDRNQTVERTVSIRGVKMHGCILKMPVFSVGPTRLIADLEGEPEDISFMIEALTGFEEASREVRLRAWEKSMNTVIG
jgi:hypothetical protein